MRFAFLDTTTFLQFRPINEIDWVDLVGDDCVTLVVCQAVIRDLNHHKDSEGRKRLRERAASALRMLGKLSDQVPPRSPIREAVELIFRERDPLLDFTSNKLNEKLSDDWLIASMLEFRLEFPDAQVTLITNDVGLKLKAAGHGLRCVQIPDRYALADEEGPEQKRIQELERELALYKLRTPDLRLVFDQAKDYVNFQLVKIPLTTDEVISRKMEEIRARHPKASGTPIRLPLLASEIGPDQIKHHNERMDNFYKAYESYLRDVDTIADSQRRQIILNIVLKNTGYSPAEDIDIYLHLPDGLRVSEDAEALIPKEPVAPTGPLSVLEERFGNLRFDLARTLMPDRGVIDAITQKTVFRNVSRPTIRRTSSFEVKFHVRELKHNFQEKLDPLFVIFDSWDTTRSFSIKYGLLAGNVPRPIPGELHIVIDINESQQ